MRACVRPQQTLSVAMTRVADALERYAPSEVSIVEDPSDADVQVLHVIGDGQDALSRLRAPAYAVMQYCFRAVQSPSGANATNGGASAFDHLWEDATAVWSYYDLREIVPAPFYYAPLGIDPEFAEAAPPPSSNHRSVVMTSGYVDGAGAEAISEVAVAASRCGLEVTHLGPPDVIDSPPPGWSSVHGVDDRELSELYGRSLWVSGLRRTEGFELPVIEGLAQGARPVVFDREEMRHWFGPFASFVPECSGEELVAELVRVFSTGPRPVSDAERSEVLMRFDWSRLVPPFWDMVLEARLEKAS